MKKGILLITLLITGLTCLSGQLLSPPDSLQMQGRAQKDELKIQLEELDLRLFPNPVKSGYFSIRSSVPFSEVKVSNIIGQSFYQRKFADQKKEVRIEIPKADQGLYLVTLTYGPMHKVVRRILVE